MDSKASTSRRTVMATGAAAMAAGAFSPASAQITSPDQGRKRVMRLAHLTDVHIQQEKMADRGFARCLNQVQSKNDPPSLIVFGGDNVMNVDSKEGGERAEAQLAVWKDVLRQECSLPHRTVIGNHDILNMQPVDGKKWAIDAFGLSDRFYDWTESDWHFIVLDSTSPNTVRGGDGGYKGMLDDLQFEWLETKLRSIPSRRPVCIVSHIPILSACAYFDGENEKTMDWVIPGSWVHIDARRLKNLFHEHSNVKLCLSGHMHLADSVDYLGVRYACNGAVCGSWWDGDYHEFGPGYAIVDLYDDGTSEVTFENYPWTPVSGESKG